MRVRWLLPALCVVGLLTSCATQDGGEKSAEGNCGGYEAFQGHGDTKVTVASQIRDVEADQLTKAWEQFQTCTGITIEYDGSATFEKDIGTRVQAGTPPDVALLSQPGLLAKMVQTGKVKPASPQLATIVGKYFPADWNRYATVGGTLYGIPVDSNVKSYVWYSPKFFKAKGYQVPQTWDQMIALSNKIAKSGVTPWCAGIESGAATGWPLTDWAEDALLRTAGTQVYDQWVAHEIAFDDPRIVEALGRVGEILRNPKFVNGGYGGVKSIATTSFQEGGLPILQNTCAMHRQASFYTNWWPASATIADDGDIFAFLLPPIDPSKGRPLLGAGDFAAAFADRPEVQAFMEYLATPDFADARVRTGGVISANKGLDKEQLTTPIQKLSVTLLTDPKVTMRFDGSDLMPASVGAGTFWTGMTAWIKGESTERTLHRIEASWPRSANN